MQLVLAGKNARMGKIATADVKYSSKEVLGVWPRREKERTTFTMTGSNVRKVPKMEKECNVMRMFRS